MSDSGKYIEKNKTRKEKRDGREGGFIGWYICYLLLHNRLTQIWWLKKHNYIKV